MSDYNLSGLSSRSFEQLIQAIAIKVFGPDIIVFGDGPDGGREATFEGTVPYPSKEQSWSGYGVVQAKFLQRPQGAPKDGEWALQQLREELAKFPSSQSGSRSGKTNKRGKKALYVRRTPDYYIFVTNVVFTPVGDQGTKDKARAVLEEFKRNAGLKDFDIWDYDKICAYLDGYEDIRHAYEGFITTGDVLARVVEWLRPRQPDFKQVIYRFLQEELLADQYANLEQAGRATEDKVPIARVFVDLPTYDEQIVDPPDEEVAVASSNLPPGFIAELVDIARDRLDPASNRGTSPSSDESGEESSYDPGRFVLIGGPGQGKTTIGQFICQLFRAAILQGRDNWVPVREIEDILGLIDDQCRNEGIELPSTRRFPLRIVLNDLAKELATSSKDGNTSVLSYIAARIKKRTDHEVTPEDLRLWLNNYPWLVIFDGLDEVPASSNRDEVLKAIRKFRIEINECNADVLIVATTRPQGYSGDFAPHVYRHKWLAPLSVARALHYGRRLAEIRYSADKDRREKVLTRLERAAHTEATARLMRSPLQVTIMTTLVGTRGQPPQERWGLFNEYYKVIYQREMEREIPASDILRAYKSDIDRIHNRVGLILQVKSEQSGETDARISKNDFGAIVADRLEEEGHEGSDRDQLQRYITEAATDRLVFLVGLQDEQIGFEIRSLQEFMAAEALMDEREAIVRQRLIKIATVSNWRNVFLFAAGKCFAERQDLRDTIYTICAELNDSVSDEVSSAVLEGSQLAMDLLEEGVVRTQPKFARLFTRLALHSLNAPPSSSHTRLAKLYDASWEPLYREELNNYLSVSDFYKSVGAWFCLLRLIATNVEWARELGDQHWPDADDQKLDILQLGVGLDNESWKLPKMIDIVPRLSPFKIASPHRRGEGFSIFEDIKTESIPDWFRAVKFLAEDNVALSNTLRIPVKLIESAEDVLSLSIFKSVNAMDDWGPDLLQLPGETHKGWIPVLATVRFLTDPSKHTLARELRTLAATSNFEEVKRNGSYLPWVLASCIASADSGQELEELAICAENGDLGDRNDWRKAEDRWLRDGISAADIEYANDERLPFNKHIAERGFPFVGVSQWSITQREQLEIIQEMLRLHERLKPSKIRAMLAEWILFTISILTRGRRKSINDANSLLTDIQLLTIIDDAASAKRRIYLTPLVLHTWDAGLSERWIELLDRLGKFTYCIASDRPNEKLIELISEAFKKDVSRVGLLHVLSLISLKGGHAAVPADLLNPELYDSPVFRSAAIIARLSQKNMNTAEAEILAGYIASTMNEDGWGANGALYMLEKNYLPFDAAVKRFLVTLLRRVPPTKWRTTQQIIQLLETSLKRRTSELEKEDTWSKLGFPKKLHHVVRNTGLLET